MGIGSVAVYSDADARAPHVREADEAVHIGPPPSAESYLRGDRIIEAAHALGRRGDSSRATGFSPSASGSRAPCATPDSSSSGRRPEAIAAMGSKTAARQLAIGANVPVVPGTTEALKDAAEARAIADQFGYPVLLKAAAGGGGKGMRVVRDAKDVESSLDAARREAKNAFGDDAVYVEKYIVGPRHVEIQVLGDQHGTMLSLNERECSVQRRHQKMIEEAPSVAVTPELRRAMGETAVRAASAAGYVNAGTCEFLLDRDGKFYFLEMNTRLQVEHPVTELVTGIDLVQWQIRIAAGETLPFKQDDIVPRGWAIECRITSEDPANGFLPSTGRISYLHLPGGPGRALGWRHRSRQRGRTVLRSDAREADRVRAHARRGDRAHASRAARAHDRRRRDVARLPSARDGRRRVPKRARSRSSGSSGGWIRSCTRRRPPRRRGRRRWSPR